MDPIKIKYFGAAKEFNELKLNPKGNWIDVYANETIFIPVWESALIPLGFAMQLPEGYEALLAPRSSTFKNWGIIVTNSIGIIDTSYCGDNDEWKLSVYCIRGVHNINGQLGALINFGDKIAQFRIIESMPHLQFEVVSSLGNADRSGFGSTGIK